MLTLSEVKERLERLDEITLIEELGVNSTDIVQAFSDNIEERYDYFSLLVEED